MIRPLFRPLILVALLALVGCNRQEEEPAVLPTVVPTYDVAALASDSSTAGEPNSVLSASMEPNATSTPVVPTPTAIVIAAATPTSDVGNSESIPPSPIATDEMTATEPETPEVDVETPEEVVDADEQITASDTSEGESAASTSDAVRGEVTEDDTGTDPETMDIVPTQEGAVDEETDTAAASDEDQSAEANDETPIVEETDNLYAGLPESIAALIPEADAARGEQLSLQNGCIGCHNLDTEMVMVGPTWYGMGDTAAERVDGQSAASYIYQSIINPNAFVVDGYLPNIMLQIYGDTLSEQDQADLIAYLLSLHEE